MRPSDIPITICVLCYGEHPELARRCLDSIIQKCPPEKYLLRVGLNECCPETVDYVRSLEQVDSLYLCKRNINQCPMMARLLCQLETEFVWWFDDDSYIKHPGALDYRLKTVRECSDTVGIWGEVAFHGHTSEFVEPEAVQLWIQNQSWYSGHPAPCGQLRYEPEFYLSGDRRWHFCSGGSWFARSVVINKLGWPPASLIKKSNDVLLGEAIRQAGYELFDLGGKGVHSNGADRRGCGEDAQTMYDQMRID